MMTPDTVFRILTHPNLSESLTDWSKLFDHDYKFTLLNPFSSNPEIRKPNHEATQLLLRSVLMVAGDNTETLVKSIIKAAEEVPGDCYAVRVLLDSHPNVDEIMEKLMENERFRSKFSRNFGYMNSLLSNPNVSVQTLDRYFSPEYLQWVECVDDVGSFIGGMKESLYWYMPYNLHHGYGRAISRNYTELACYRYKEALPKELPVNWKRKMLQTIYKEDSVDYKLLDVIIEELGG